MRQDLSFALRNLTRNPGLFAISILTLALGIGINTAMFSVVHAVLLRPLPVREPDRLHMIWARIPRMNIPLAFVEYNTFMEWWRARARSFEGLAAYSPGSANMTSGDQPRSVRTCRVSASFLSVIGMSPVLGRDFLPEEDQPGASRVALISNGLWKERFGNDHGVVGRPIVLDGNSYTIIGVLPATFDLEPHDVYMPIAHSSARAPGMPSVGVYARLKRGVALKTAQAEIDGLCRGWVAQYHYPNTWGAGVWPIHDFRVRDVRVSIIVLAVAVAMVLLIACTNVANFCWRGPEHASVKSRSGSRWEPGAAASCASFLRKAECSPQSPPGWDCCWPGARSACWWPAKYGCRRSGPSRSMRPFCCSL